MKNKAPSLRKSLLNRLAILFAVVGLVCATLTSGSLYLYYRSTLNTEMRDFSSRFESYTRTFLRRIDLNADLLASPERTICSDRRLSAWLTEEKMTVIGVGTESLWSATEYAHDMTEALGGHITISTIWKRGKPPAVIAALPMDTAETGGGRTALLAVKYLDDEWLKNAASDLGVQLVITDRDGRILSSSISLPADLKNLGMGRIKNDSVLEINGAHYGFHLFPFGEEGRYGILARADDLRNLAFFLSGVLAAVFAMALVIIFIQYRKISGRTTGEIDNLAEWADNYLTKLESGKPPPMKYSELKRLAEAFDNILSRLDAALYEIEGKNAELANQVEAATEELKDRNILLDSIVTEMPQAVFLLDAKGFVLNANNHAREFFGVENGKELPSDLRDQISGIAPGERDGFLAKGGRDFIIHKRMLEKMPKTLVLAMDVTENKIMQEHLFQTQKLESVSRLAGGVAHDFNNALASIIPSVDMLRMKINDEKALGYVETIEKAALRGADVVRKLLAFSRAGTFNPKILSLNEVVEGAIKVFTPSAKKASIIWQPGEKLPGVYGDEAHLQQLIFNLAINSLDATDGRCTITFKTWEDRDKGMVCLSVADDGPGVPEKIASHIFDPFFTTKTQAEAKTQGTGLGLAVAYGVVDRHKGRIRLVSHAGPGALFEIELPSCDREPAVEGDADKKPGPVCGDDIIIGKR